MSVHLGRQHRKNQAKSEGGALIGLTCGGVVPCRSMYALLMLLPQSEAFKTLHARLHSVPTVTLLKMDSQPPVVRPSPTVEATPARRSQDGPADTRCSCAFQARSPWSFQSILQRFGSSTFHECHYKSICLAFSERAWACIMICSDAATPRSQVFARMLHVTTYC